LKCEQPHIIVNQLSKKLNGPKNAREVLAQFRDGPPYLKQARPIHLAYVVTKSHDAAKVLGFKQLILFILNMVKDAGEGDHRCSRELVILKAFEDECKQALGSHRMSGKFFVL
jgi:hypothetical protein